MPSLFDPVRIGALELPNRIIMAPLTRMRAFNERSPGAIHAKHYAQRASAGLIISEATSVSPQGVGYPNTPGIWSEAQIAGWTEVTSAVHAAGGLIVSQLWHVGRVSDPVLLDGKLPVAPSAIAPEGHVNILRPQRPYVVPRALETEEIAGIVEDFRVGAANALRAGFDGVELHGANGYLFDQFLHDGSNKRTDRYGGSIENRARFLLEAVDALLTVWPADRIGVHLNLMSSSYSMQDSDPRALFSYVAEQLDARKLAFIFARESLELGDRRIGLDVRRLFKGAYIVNEGLTKESAEQAIARGEADAAAFGRPYIANADLVERFRRNAPLNAVNAETIYSADETGYNDYPLLGETVAAE
ncbi:alkene reductase [Azospirillum rugosum]|uniref:2,4-dienoyl-CoA reductase-like NADH-dependent reductase (Old Yellow Enzyme family) n=1 Tax=Azospirillum rugosum TaxID=416170 RepID=A0ABS4SUM7_9PROT|nr:alkene reductase [Azospirillum rugosum]MBP2296271.1 2,4-dienoyl-CoA reductase-like NADH-dependent reductase (Old Yellow Enzyme family) [Azospirillum rugosum]MDQ0529792.1 2,4-dienoyl-CoA reductase-like NADH-dependent reductase (Old Yellow Enzyme family) [Azospirillum rugosum]